MPADCGNSGCTKFDTDTVLGGPDGDTIDYSPRSDNLTIAIDGSTKSGGFMENDTLSGIENAERRRPATTPSTSTTPPTRSRRCGHRRHVGRNGNDYLNGNEGNDFLEGDEGNDWLTGGEGDDTLEARAGNDWLYGGNGTDLVSYYDATSGVTARIGTGTSGVTGEADTIGPDVENLEGSSYNDHLYGSATANN